MSAEPRSMPGPLSVEDARALFSGDLLRLGRELRGWSQSELAHKIGVSPAAVSQFEKGTSRPSGERLHAIAQALGVPVGFFAHRGDTAELECGAFFRSLRSTPAAARRRAHAMALLVHWFATALNRHVRLPEPSIPRHPVDPDAELAELENTAEKVRAEFELGAKPVEHAVRTVELHGAVTARLEVGQHHVDAFSVTFEDRPVLMLSADKRDRGRSRLDVAHELGHLVMHDEQDVGEKHAEQQAYGFAAAFLMPASAIEHRLPSQADLSRLLQLKQEWGTSMQALLHRAHTLGRMNRHEYVRAMKMFSARGWRRQEPGDLGAPEEPQLLQHAVQAAEDSGVGLTAIITQADLPEQDIEELLRSSRDHRPDVPL